MISNKIVKITKANLFDKGWTLFSPLDVGIIKDRSFKETAVSDIVKLITFSNTVNLILTEPCLSSRIVDEIKWANKYIKLNLIAKNKEIIEHYSSLCFTQTEIDPSVDFNYIGILGKENAFFIIIDGFSETNNLINEVYFDKKKANPSFDFLNDVSKAFIVDSKFNKQYDKLIFDLKKCEIETFYLGNVEFFTKDTQLKVDSLNVKLCVSPFTSNGVLLIKKDGRLLVLLQISKDIYVTYYIESSNSLFGPVYSSLNLADTIDVKAIGDNVFSCNNGTLTELHIEKVKTINCERLIPTMDKFINEEFDSSITDDHNAYSAEAESVEYIFTLIPPIIDDSFVESNIYDEIHSLEKELVLVNKLNVEKINESYHSFLEEDYGILSFLEKGNELTNGISGSVKKCDYHGYYRVLNHYCELYENFNLQLKEILKKMFVVINNESSNIKFDKFDVEIEGYKKTIEEKERLIANGVDVLSNKRRVDILTQKINDLLKLKENLIVRSSSHNDQAADEFIKLCDSILSGKYKKTTTEESIGNVIKQNDVSKDEKLKCFVITHLFGIYKYVVDGLSVIKKLLKIEIPEDYQVFDKDGKRYIVINELDEFDTTKELRKKFLLNCVTRR